MKIQNINNIRNENQSHFFNASITAIINTVSSIFHNVKDTILWPITYAKNYFNKRRVRKACADAAEMRKLQQVVTTTFTNTSINELRIPFPEEKKRMIACADAAIKRNISRQETAPNSLHTEAIIPQNNSEDTSKVYQEKMEIQRAALHAAKTREKISRLRQEFLTRIVSAKELGKQKAINHPLVNLKEEIAKNRVVLVSDNGEKYDLGSHFHGFGKTFIKNGNFHVESTREHFKFRFKMSPKANKRFQQFIKDTDQLNDIKKLPVDIQIIKPKNISLWNPLDNFIIQSDRLGIAVLFEQSSNHISIEMPSDKSLQDLIEFTALIGLPEILQPLTQDDIEQLKIRRLFHTFSPKENEDLEKIIDPSISTAELKEKIVQNFPSMEEKLKKYLPRISQEEVLPGKIQYRINGLSSEIYNAGGVALMSLIRKHSEDKIFETLASILKIGAIPLKFHRFGRGSLDTCFYTQIIRENDFQKKFEEVTGYISSSNIDETHECGIRILISLDALEFDHYAKKFAFNGDDGSIISKVQSPSSLGKAHEIGFPDGVDRKFIKGIAVPNQGTYDRLVEYLQLKQLIINDTILGQSVSSFIRFGEIITPELVA